MTDDTLNVLGEITHIALNQMVAMSKRIKVKQDMTHKIMFPIIILKVTMKYVSLKCMCDFYTFSKIISQDKSNMLFQRTLYI